MIIINHFIIIDINHVLPIAEMSSAKKCFSFIHFWNVYSLFQDRVQMTSPWWNISWPSKEDSRSFGFSPSFGIFHSVAPCTVLEDILIS